MPRARPETSSPPASSLRIVDAATAAEEADYEAVVSAAAVDRRLLRGPFASNVWGGRYAVTALGGQGSQGATFTGVDRKTGARVAVKLFDLGRAKDWKAQELFDREVATLQRLSHPGVPRFVDVVKDDDTGARALVMEFIDGESLADVLARERTLPEKRLWPLLVDVAGVLSAVHGEGVVHRDLKPANLIVRPGGGVAVVDFGGVGVVRGQAGSTVVGTFGYMAPEQLYGAQTPATDLYALGATVLHAATGQAPEDQPRQGLAIDVDAAAPFLSAPLRALLARLLQPDPTSRPKDAQALARELAALARGKASPVREPDDVAGPGARGVDEQGSVDAIWREDEAARAMEATGGVLGVVAAVVGLLATVGLGRVLLPFLLTVLGLLGTDAQRRQLHALRDVIDKKARAAQHSLERQAVKSAGTLDALSDDERRRRQKRNKKLDRKIERVERKARRLHDRRDEFWRL
jgi:hypothetical protein